MLAIVIHLFLLHFLTLPQLLEIYTPKFIPHAKVELNTKFLFNNEKGYKVTELLMIFVFKPGIYSV